jgi:hypothetical protein
MPWQGGWHLHPRHRRQFSVIRPLHWFFPPFHKQGFFFGSQRRESQNVFVNDSARAFALFVQRLQVALRRSFPRFRTCGDGRLVLCPRQCRVVPRRSFLRLRIAFGSHCGYRDCLSIGDTRPHAPDRLFPDKRPLEHLSAYSTLPLPLGQRLRLVAFVIFLHALISVARSAFLHRTFLFFAESALRRHARKTSLLLRCDAI